MSKWMKHHRRSETYADFAERCLKAGDLEEAATLYELAANAEYQAYNELMAEALPPAIAKVAGFAKPVVYGAARAVYRNIPDPVLSWVKTRARQGMDILSPPLEQTRQNVLAAVGRLGQALKELQH